MGLASKARQSWSKNRKRPHFASLSQANPSPESKNFFFNRTKKSSRICRGFEHLSSCSSWWVITKKPRANILALLGVKGLGAGTTWAPNALERCSNPWKAWQVFRCAIKKTFFNYGFRLFEWCHNWSTYRPLWLTSSGPGSKPLDGSISHKFLLGTSLKSESFDTLDDLLGFQVQKLWSKINKIVDFNPIIRQLKLIYFRSAWSKDRPRAACGLWTVFVRIANAFCMPYITQSHTYIVLATQPLQVTHDWIAGQ